MNQVSVIATGLWAKVQSEGQASAVFTRLNVKTGSPQTPSPLVLKTETKPASIDQKFTFAPHTINKTDVSRYSFRLGDRSTHKAVSTKYQDKATGKLAVVKLNNDAAPDGLPPVHTDRHIHPNKTAAEQAAKARLAAFNRSTAGVRLEMPGRSDLFAERMINAQGFKDGLDGEYLVDSREQVFTQSGWSTTIECNAGKKGKAKVKGKKHEKTLKIIQL